MSLSLLQLNNCTSWHYDKDPVLMDNELLQKAVAEQSCQIAKAGEIHFEQVTKLCLGYKDIAVIDNLRKFTSLTRLQLNNNLIEKIKGLEHLVNLTWLDLSFNKIEKIEGLQSLQKLEVLNLSDNRISVIENMDKLETLTNLFIANNLLKQLDNVCYLRKFKNLFNLNLCGNPISEDGDNNYFVVAFLPNLTWLDYRLLSEKTKNEASSKYQYALEKMRDEELKTQQAHDAEKSQNAELQLHKDAFVEFLNGPYLFKDMLKNDPESDILHSIPKVAHLLQTFEEQMVDLCMQLFEIGLSEHKRRETEVNSFYSGYTKAERDYQQIASQILEDFEEQHRTRKSELRQLSDPDVVKVKMSQYKDEISKLSNSLITVEFQMVHQLEGIIKLLDVNISEMVVNFTETAQGIFSQCRDQEDSFYRNVEKIMVETLEEVAKDDLEDDLSEDARILLTDKDTVMDALATAHENHQLIITDRETTLVTGVDAWKVALFKQIEEQDLKWHRMRVLDIHRHGDHLREQLDELH